MPLPRRSAQRFLCLAEEPAEPAGSERCSTNGAAAAGLVGQWQGLWRPQAARRPAGSHGETRCPNRVARLTRLAGIKAQTGYKRRPGSHGGKPSLAVDNTLDRQFNVAAPDRDITYIRSLEGFAYLAVVFDLYCRRVVGWTMQSRQITDVVLQAVHMAVWRRKRKQ